MSKYRCPRCGAAHKDPVNACRLCGQAMGADAEIPLAVQTDATASFSKYRRQSMMPYIFGGLALVIAIGVAAVAFGLVDSNEIGDAAQEVPVLGDRTGSWPAYDDPEGRFTAVLPVEEPTVTETEMLGTTATVTEAPIGEQMDLTIVWLENPQLQGDTTASQLEPLAEQYAALSNAELDGNVGEGSHQGQPAIVASASGFNYEGAPGHMEMRLIKIGDDVVILSTASAVENPEQHARLVGGFEFTNTNTAPATDDTSPE